ncbi:MAG: right-handed parallel beta-helix repeat-containing protein [Gemmatimonadota bacterium]|nr:MAG: right-handed parallel beta-helix repeat-containing protein [Gemmatimonadota bacterium]
MLRKERMVITCFCFILLFQSADAYIEKSGNVSGETWIDTTYYITGSITVNDDETLTIEAGAVIKFKPDLRLKVYGTLVATGEEGNEIVFTASSDTDHGQPIPEAAGIPSPGSWQGIYFDGLDYRDGTGQLDWCIIRYGGQAGYDAPNANAFFRLSGSSYFRDCTSEYSATSGIKLSQCSPSIENNIFSNNVNHGLDVEGGSSVVDNNTFNNNGGYGAYLDGVACKSYTRNQGVDNGINGFGVIGTVESHCTWSMGSGSFPFVLPDEVEVQEGGELTFSENAIVKGDSLGLLTVNGKLDATFVTFTSLKDDDIGGNSDGDRGSPSCGDWYGIYVTGTGRFDGCNIKYGGRQGGYQVPLANVRFSNCDSSCFRNSQSGFSAEHGARVHNCSPEISDSRFYGNLGHGIFAQGSSSAPAIRNNVLGDDDGYWSGNGGWGVYLDDVILTSYANNKGGENGINAIGVSGTVTENCEWEMGVSGSVDFPFVILKENQVSVPLGHTLTLTSRTIIKADSSSSILVDGTLTAEGDYQRGTVVFTSFKDDEYGGDTNSDGPSSGEQGDWDGIFLNGQGDKQGIGEFNTCVIRYGGYRHGSAEANIRFNQSDSGHITNSLCEYSDYIGVEVISCSPDISGNEFLHNADSGLYVFGNQAKPVIADNIFTGNGLDAFGPGDSTYAVVLSSTILMSYTGNTGSRNGINAFAMNGLIEDSVTWSMPDQDFLFIMTENIDVEKEGTLSLSAGTILKAKDGTELNVKGVLEARGTEGDPVFITSIGDNIGGNKLSGEQVINIEPGAWDGIYLNGQDENLGIGKFDWCIIRFGGRSGQYNPMANIRFDKSDSGYFRHSISEYSKFSGIRIDNCSPVLDSSSMNFNLKDGLMAVGDSSAPIVINCSFNKNSEYGANMDDIILTGYIDNTGNENGTNGFRVKGWVNESCSWSMGSETFPFIMKDVLVDDEATLTLSAGTTIMAESNGRMKVYGTLDVNGNYGEYVIFTSVKDPDWGVVLGDSLEEPGPGDWDGIYLYGKHEDKGIGLFDYCLVLYGGAIGHVIEANIYFNESDSGYVNHSDIHESAAYGVKVEGCSPTFRRNLITHNIGPGIYSGANSKPDLGRDAAANQGKNLISFNDNNGFGVYNASNSTIKAYCNSWGYTTVEDIDTHLRDNEEGGGEILFDPWLEKCPKRETTKQSNGKDGKVKDPISTATGELYNEMVDLYLGGPLPLYFSRYYASLLTRDGNVNSRFGTNWMHNFDLKLILDGDDASAVYYGGKTISFQKDDFNWELVYSEPIIYQLVESGNEFKLMDPERSLIFTFNENGMFVQVADRNGNVLDLTYNDDMLSQVSDGRGRSLSFLYTDDKLTQVQDQSGRMVSYSYTGNNLTEFTDANGYSTMYTYTETDGYTGLLTSTTRSEGNTPYTQIYDELGRVLSQTDSRSNATRLAYDSPAEGMTTITDPLLNATTHTHEDFKRLTQYLDNNNESCYITYDANNRRTGITDRLGDETTFTYHEASGKISTTTDAEGNTTSYIYSSQAQGDFDFYNLTRIEYQNETSITMSYDDSGNLLTLTDQAGQNWSYSYNSMGQMTSATNPAGGTTNYSYNSDGSLASYTDHFGNTTSIVYDTYKRPQQVTYPDGTTRLFTYDEKDNLTSATDERGMKTILSYDTNGNLKTVTDPMNNNLSLEYDGNDAIISSSDRLNATTYYFYDGNELLSSITNPAVEATDFLYDSHGWLTSVTDPDGHTSTIAYDEEGVVTSLTDALSNTWSYMSDRLGRITRILIPEGSSHDFTYDSMGRVSTYTDPLSRSTTYTYDDRGFITGWSLPGNLSADYDRDNLGNIISVIDPNGESWTRDYDEMGRLTTETDPLSRSTIYNYDNRSRVSNITYPGGSLEITHDEAGNIVRKLYSDGTDISFAYDDNNRLYSSNDLSLEYDARDDIVACNGLLMIRDQAGRISSLTLAPEKVITYSYNGRGLVIQVTDWLGGTTVIDYDEAGHIISITRPNGIITTYSYDNDGRLISIDEASSARLSSISLTRNSAGDITSETRNVPLIPDLSLDTQTLSYDEACQVTEFTYDEMGRLTEDIRRSYSWNLASRLVSYTEAGNTVTFTYDGSGLLHTRTSEDVTREYVWNYALGLPSISLVKENGHDIMFYIHLPGGRLLYSIDASNDTRHYYHFDETGTTLFLTDEAGAITDTYGITPYGETVTKTGITENPFTFCGAFGVLQEGDTGLYSMRARFYDSGTGRFISTDVINSIHPIEINPYQYAMQNPMAHSDPMGLQTFHYSFLDNYILPFFVDYYINMSRKKVEAPMQPPALNPTFDAAKDRDQSDLKPSSDRDGGFSFISSRYTLRDEPMFWGGIWPEVGFATPTPTP